MTDASEARRQQVIAQEMAKPGLRGKVNAKCAECIFDPDGGGGSWRQQVEACTAVNCPLYDVRPRADKRQKSDSSGSEQPSRGDWP